MYMENIAALGWELQQDAVDKSHLVALIPLQYKRIKDFRRKIAAWVGLVWSVAALQGVSVSERSCR